MGTQYLVTVGSEHPNWGAAEKNAVARRRRKEQRPAGLNFRLGSGLPGEAALSPAPGGGRGGPRRVRGGAVIPWACFGGSYAGRSKPLVSGRWRSAS